MRPLERHQSWETLFHLEGKKISIDSHNCLSRKVKEDHIWGPGVLLVGSQAHGRYFNLLSPEINQVFVALILGLSSTRKMGMTLGMPSACSVHSSWEWQTPGSWNCPQPSPTVQLLFLCALCSKSCSPFAVVSLEPSQLWAFCSLQVWGRWCFKWLQPQTANITTE